MDLRKKSKQLPYRLCSNKLFRYVIALLFLLKFYRVQHCPETDGKVIWRVEDGILHMGTTPSGELKWTTKIPFNHSIEAIEQNVSRMLIREPFDECQVQGYPSCPCALQTDFRQDIDYKLYYLTISNGIFMGIVPMALMIFFNILV